MDLRKLLDDTERCALSLRIYLYITAAVAVCCVRTLHVSICHGLTCSKVTAPGPPYADIEVCRPNATFLGTVTVTVRPHIVTNLCCTGVTYCVCR